MRAAVLALVAGALGLSAVSPAFAAPPPHAQPPRLTWTADANPFAIRISVDGAPLLHQQVGLPGAGSRLSYGTRESGAMQTLTSLLETRPAPRGAIYRVATTEPDRTATVTVRRTARGLRVAADLGSGSSTVTTVYESFASTPGEHFLGAGEQRGPVDLAGQIVPVKVWHECGTAKESPFFASSRGYGVRFETTAVGRMAFGRVRAAKSCQLGTAPCEIATGLAVVQACFKTASFSYRVYAGPPERVVRAVAAETGRPPMPQPSQFALMKWRDAVKGEAALVADADHLAAAGIPLGWLILDNPWETAACIGRLTFDAGAYPHPDQLVRRIHERGLRLMLWVSPMVRIGCDSGYPGDRVIGTDRDQALDLTDAAVAARFEQLLAGVLASGVDGFKVDRGDEVDLELRRLAGGSGEKLHNTYPLLLAQSVDRAARKARGAPIPTLFRAGSTGAQKTVTGSWSGDLPGSWDGLARAVRSAQTAGLVGYSTWGSDVGGYFSSSLTADVFVRWTQLGAISPVFEVGGDGPNATPWVLGARAMAGLRSSAILHYELFPYHYELARHATATGIPILRPLALEDPGDQRSWRAELEVLVGSDLLAAPVTRAGSAARVYLPRGGWIDLASGTTTAGPVSLRRQTPLDELPLYLRRGAAIPFNLREPDVWRAPWRLNDLFRPGRGGWLVAPGFAGAAAGASADYGSLRASGSSSRIRVRLSDARPETQVVVLGTRTPTKVTIAGMPVARSRTAAALRGAREGWLVRPAPFAGVVLKLAPRSGRALVELDY